LQKISNSIKIAIMNGKHRKTLELVFTKPTSTSLEWARIEALFVAAGAQTVEGDGSRVRFVLHDIVGTFHRPHPAKEAKPYQVKDARQFLEQAGVTP
jgi:HicA toxin of bacterial toxin-antitoxin,